jgi:hypothetical protein
MLNINIATSEVWRILLIGRPIIKGHNSNVLTPGWPLVGSLFTPSWTYTKLKQLDPALLGEIQARTHYIHNG